MHTQAGGGGHQNAWGWKVEAVHEKENKRNRLENGTSIAFEFEWQSSIEMREGTGKDGLLASPPL